MKFKLKGHEHEGWELDPELLYTVWINGKLTHMP